MGVVVILVAVVVVGIVVAFFRAVFGGATFRRQRRKRGEGDGGDRRGPRADAHAGASNWPGAGGLGRWGTWNEPGA